MEDLKCLVCHALKSEAEFSLTRSGRGRRVMCKDCEEVARQQKKQKHLDNWSEYKNRMLLQWHGITLADYNILLKRQNGVCAICKQPETFKNRHGRVYALAVDHDHVTDQIRGLLCNGCNTAIGSLKDDTERMLAAIEYLQNALRQRKIVQLAMFAD